MSEDDAREGDGHRREDDQVHKPVKAIQEDATFSIALTLHNHTLTHNYNKYSAVK